MTLMNLMLVTQLRNTEIHIYDLPDIKTRPGITHILTSWREKTEMVF